MGAVESSSGNIFCNFDALPSTSIDDPESLPSTTEESISPSVVEFQQTTRVDALTKRDRPTIVKDNQENSSFKIKRRENIGLKTQSKSFSKNDSFRIVATRLFWFCGPRQLKFESVEKTSDQQSLIKSALSNNFVFTDLDDTDMSSLIDAMVFVKVNKGRNVICQGDPGDYFYVIESGSYSVIINGVVVRTIEGSGSFGEHALLYNAPRGATIRAASNGALFALDRIAFQSILSSSLESKNSDVIKALRSVSILSNLSDEEFSRLADTVVVLKFDEGTRIIEKGTAGNNFYFIKDGVCAVSDNEVKGIKLKAGQYFGERALINKEPRTATITAITPVIVMALDKDAFDELLGPLQQVLDRQVRDNTKRQLENIAANRTNSIPEKLKLKLNLKDLKELALLGSGGFGRVTLVQHKKGGKVYALKAMSKSAIVDQNQQENILNEKRSMVIVGDHPFIIQLRQTFKDSRRLYMLLEFVQGGELLSRIEITNGLSEAASKFYSYGVALVLQHMHAKNVAYRDLKPENILIDSQGYPKIVDFGLSKIIMGKSFTVCGTLEYMAPELLLGRGHSRAVDYWALGILIYEMILAATPFKDSSDSAIMKNIVQKKLEPNAKIAGDCQDLLGKLLRRAVKNRLGNLSGGPGDIINSPWYSTYTRDAFLAKRIEVPWVPIVTGAADASKYTPHPDDDIHGTAKAPKVDSSLWDADW